LCKWSQTRGKPVPFPFSLFLNDVDTFLENKNITGLQTISDEIENNLDIYLKLLEKPFPPYLIKGLFEIYKGTK
jgi:hypothetical protein